MSPSRSAYSPLRRVVTLAMAAVMTASLLSVVRLAEPEPVGDRDITAHLAEPEEFSEIPVETAPPLPEEPESTWSPPTDPEWPGSGTVRLAVDRDRGWPVLTEGMAGDIPVGVRPVPGAAAPAEVAVSVLDQSHSRRLGVSGPVLVVSGDDDGQVETRIGYDRLRHLYGGGWEQRLTLTELPACAATTPSRPECREPVATEVTKDAAESQLSTRVTTTATGSATVFAVTASAASEEGDYRASDLSASGSWTAGDSSGGFSYSNPLRLPPAEGPLPELSLDYSSQLVDGRMAGANNQASWVGDGWEYAPGFVERSYVTCLDDRSAEGGKDPNNKNNQTVDQCWKGKSEHVTVSLNGSNTTLIKDDSSGTWRAQQDANWKVELLGSPATSSAATTERWLITTPDGTRYSFGETAAANSRWTIPVFGNHSGEPCHASTFKGSSCRQAWRWQLDQAVDVHGNQVKYFYQNETGYYGAAGDQDNRVSFHRGGYLERIEYGLHTAHSSVAATARVRFDVADRCLASECRRDGKPVNASWPDVPWDKECATAPCTDKLAPVFFSTKRLTKITTEIRDGATFRPVESWSLTHEFKAPRTAGSASLWLKEIVHAGHIGGTVTDPSVRFFGVELANRANALAGAPIFSRWRLQTIRTESGADIHVTYSEPDCDTHSLPGAPESNTRRCYPVYWTPEGYFEPKRDWFHKYRVEEISEIDRTADQPAITTRYEYDTTGGGTSVLWGWDDSEFTKKKHRTYGQWRGYSQVTTKVGAPGSGTPLTTRKRFYRGLNGQPLPGGGTRSVNVSDAEGNTYPDHPTLAGATLEEATLNGSTIVEAATTAYWTRQTAARSHDGGTDRAHLTGPSVVKTRKQLTGSSWARTETRTSYNNEGQPTEVSDLGDTGKGGDETCTRTTYVTNDSRWIRETVSRVETVAKACTATVSRPADVLSDVRTYYDGASSLTAAPTRGLVTRKETLDRWSGGAVYATTARYAHDALGRVTSTTDARGGVTTTAYTPAGPGPVTATATTNPLGHRVTTYQQPAWGEPTSVVDANNKRTDLSHDPLGRLTQVWLPGRNRNQTPNLEFSYLVRTNGPLAVTTKRLGPNGNQITEIGLFDSLYRSVQTQRDALGGTRLVEGTGYNDRGQEAYSSGPNHAQGRPQTALLAVDPGGDRARTAYTYDPVGRVVKEALWSYNAELWSTTTSYGGNSAAWQTAVTPPRGETATATLTDVRGQVVELRQYHGTAPSGSYDSTTYTYTPRGDLATVTGPAGARWTYEYDLRGREIRTSDPDKGITTLAYDNADEVVSSTDARGELVATEYDALGRQSKRFFNGQLAAQWVYDTVAKGHLTRATSIVDGHSFVREIGLYSDTYQVQDEESVIPAMPGLEGIAGRYVSTFTFHPDGSPHRSSLPRVGGLEREIVANTYDDLGNITRVVGTGSASGTNTVYVDEATYSPHGELLQRKLGANNQPQGYQTYIYEEVTRRLSEFYFDRDASVGNVAALSYTYDHAGNVLSMANRPQDGDGAPRPGMSDVQCFRYDHLRRLTSAWTQGTGQCVATSPSPDAIGGAAPYWKTYAFDAAGSRTSVTDRRAGTTSQYGYASTGARHAVRTVTTGGQVDHYDWDAAGNLAYRRVGEVTETFQWSPHGKLTGIEGPDGDTQMVYDVDGNRIARIDPDGSATAFVAGHELTRSAGVTTATRYYEHAGDVVASRSDEGNGTAGDVIWLATDQHDSAWWAVNSRTRVETVRYRDPYGLPRGSGSGGGGAWPAGQRGFVGGVEDPTGLVLLGARFYDPALGAFLSVDPEIDEYDPQRMHPFAYANNSPVTFADPDGLFFGAVKNAAKKVGGAVADGAKAAAKAVVDNAGTIATVAGTVALVATFLPPPAQVVAAAAGAVAFVAGAIDTAKSCSGGDNMGCAMGVASMVPGVRQARNAARGVGAVKNAAKKKASGGCNSFLPGTPVLLADGSYKPIEKIELDDVVAAADPETGKEGARPVTDLITGEGDKRLVDIEVDADGDGVADGTVTATDGHPFWVDDRRTWLRAEHLRPGDALLTPDGARVSVIAIVAYDAVATVHNLTVDDIHTYYVKVGDTDVLVHNQGNDDVCSVPAPSMHREPIGPIAPDGRRPAWNGAGGPAGPATKYDRRNQYRSHTPAARAATLRQYPVCVYCGIRPATQADHIWPVRAYHYARGWWQSRATRSSAINNRGNLTGACQPCNNEKSGMTLGTGRGQWWPSRWPRGRWWPFGGGPRYG